jgi:hypothetical protein
MAAAAPRIDRMYRVPGNREVPFAVVLGMDPSLTALQVVGYWLALHGMALDKPVTLLQGPVIRARATAAQLEDAFNVTFWYDSPQRVAIHIDGVPPMAPPAIRRYIKVIVGLDTRTALSALTSGAATSDAWN